MDVILRFPDGHIRVLIYDMRASDLVTPLDVLVARLQTWGVYYGKRRFSPVGARMVTTTNSVNFEITLEEVDER